MPVTFTNSWPDPVPQHGGSNIAKNIDQFFATGRESVACQAMRKVLPHLERIQPRHILDIGSWHLKQSIEFLHVFPEAYVHAFEPTPESYELCVKTQRGLEQEFRSRVQVWPLALGEENAQIDFFVVDPSRGDDNQGAASRYEFVPGMNGSFYNKNWVQKRIIASMQTLDYWVENNSIDQPIDMIWMDTQGGELRVLQGATKTLETVKIIFTEVGIKEYYQGQGLKPEIDAFLLARGFQEVTEAFELNGFEFEGNTVYVRN